MIRPIILHVYITTRKIIHKQQEKRLLATIQMKHSKPSLLPPSNAINHPTILFNDQKQP